MRGGHTDFDPWRPDRACHIAAVGGTLVRKAEARKGVASVWSSGRSRAAATLRVGTPAAGWGAVLA